MAQAKTDDITKLPVPEISDELIHWLRTMHPQRVIGKNEQFHEAHRKAGLQDLIDKLHFFNRLQAKAEAEDYEDDTEKADVEQALVWEAPTREQEENGFVLRIS